MQNWTDTLGRRSMGQAPGFGVPRDLADLDRSELDEEAERRGLDPAELKTKADVVAAIEGR